MLNENQIANRVRQVFQIILDLDADQKLDVLEKTATQVSVRLANIKTAPAPPKSFGDKIRTAIDVGLSQANPQMVRAALDYEAEQAGKEYLSKLTVNIVPYRVKDDSLTKIVMEADEDTVGQIEGAVLKRRSTK